LCWSKRKPISRFVINHIHITGIKTYFPTPNSSLYLPPPFISPPDVYNPFNTSTQTYQYQPIYYNSVNILTQSLTNTNHNNVIVDNHQTSVRISNNNNNNYCGYCLPSTTQNSQELSTSSTSQHQELLPLITGNHSSGVESSGSLILNHFTDISLSDSLKHQALINQFNNNNNNNNNIHNNNIIISENNNSTRSSSGDIFHKEIIMVRIVN
jgi:hypothetical protein